MDGQFPRSEVMNAKKKEPVLSRVENYDDMPIGFIRTQPSRRRPIVAANTAMARMLGYDNPRDIIKLTPREIYWDLFVRKSILSELAGADELYGREVALKRKDGGKAWVRANYKVVRNPRGGIQHLNVAMIDISEQKTAEEGLGKVEAQYQSLVEDLPAITYTALIGDMASSAYMSPQVEKILGYTPKEFVDTPHMWEKLFHPEDYDRINQEVAQAGAAGKVFESEYRMIAKDGRIVWFHDRAAIVRDSAGRPAMFRGVMYDITDRKRAEESFHEAVNRLKDFQSLVNLSPVIVIVWRAEPGWPVEFISRNIDQFGYSAEDFISGRVRWQNFSHPDDDARLQKEVAAYIRDGVDEFTLEYRMFTRDGQVRWVEDRSVALRDAGGKIVRFRGIVLDVTQRKLAEEAYRSAMRQLGTVREEERKRLAYDLHDAVGQGMFALLLGMSTLRDRVKDDAETAKTVSGLCSECSKLIQDVRKISQGLYPFNLEQFGLCAALRQFTSIYSGAGIQLSVLCSKDAVRVQLPNDVGIVFYRIAQGAVSNAIQHAGPKRVEVRLRHRNRQLVLTVTDDGRGFQPKAVQGLGLISMRKQAQAIGAEFSIASRPGQTVVELRLPPPKPRAK
jgi:PAS domain S-box-containing protein